MAKRPMRRMTAMNEDSQGRPRRPRVESGSLSDTARDMSFNAVRVAAETAKAALIGMQQFGRAMADMAAPVARRSVRTANDVARAAMDATRQMTHSSSGPGDDTKRPETGATNQPAAGAARRPVRSGRRKSTRRRVA